MEKKSESITKNGLKEIDVNKQDINNKTTRKFIILPKYKYQLNGSFSDYFFYYPICKPVVLIGPINRILTHYINQHPKKISNLKHLISIKRYLYCKSKVIIN